MNHILFYVLVATKGGPTRLQIIDSLLKEPQNSNQLATSLSFDYKTIQHHLRVLEQNKIVGIIQKGSYGAMYYVNEDHRAYLEENRDEFGKTFLKKGMKR